MRIRWYGQSAFLLTGEQHTVLIDPFGAIGEQAKARGMTFDYPEIEPVAADVLLITHEHGDHNGVDCATGSPATFRSTAGTFESPIGEIVGVASEHDSVAGTQRGPNTIFRFELDGMRFCHLGDFGQPALRPEQAAAIGEVDVLFVPAGGGPTIGAGPAADLVRTLWPRLVVPMHYRTPAIGFLDPPDEFLDDLGAPVEEVGTEFDPATALSETDGPRVALAAAPVSG
jgi:L-ascorbate metabolism protein UlaG (beta-lactamase superfamily)